MQFLQTEFPLVIFSPLPSLQAIQSKQLQIKTEHKNCHGAMKSKALVSSMFAGISMCSHRTMALKKSIIFDCLFWGHTW